MKLFLLHIALILSSTVFGQYLTTKVSEEQILIGETVELTYKIKTKKSDSIFFQEKNTEIQSQIMTSSSLTKEGPLFEIVERFNDTTTVNANYKYWEGTYKVTVWDSGSFVIPAPSVLINDSTFFFKDISVEALLVAPKKGVDLYDIKENYADIPPKPFAPWEFIKNNWIWLSILLLATFIFFYFKRRNDMPEVEEKRRVSLKRRTLIAIEALEDEKLWEKDKLKEHFVELSYILRSYLTTRYQISLLERTTHQTKLLLSEKGLNDDTIDTIIRILSQADMVKFAKSKPGIIDILKVSTLAKQIVAETSPLEIEDAE